MLTHLTIENYALIDHLDIDFFQGFTAITGETGAGKSIMVDALDLALGKRADNQFLLDPTRKCVVEAVFAISNYNLQYFFELNALDYDNLAIIRRELSPNGKSRAFINDTPVTLGQLKALGDLLVDIHAQHATTSLHDPAFQLSVVDSYAELGPEVGAFRLKFDQLGKTKERLDKLVRQEEQAKSSLDYKQFLLDELLAANLDPDEQGRLEENLTLITHAEEIKSALYQAQGMIGEEENSCLNLLSVAENNLQKVSAYHSGLEQLYQRLKSDLIDLKDILMEMEKINDSIEFSQAQMDEIRQRLDFIYRLQHKHHVNSVRELLDIAERLKNELTEFSSLESLIESLQHEIEMMDEALKIDAESISAKRKEAFRPLETEIMKLLRHMGIQEASFEIRQQPLPGYNASGMDLIEFFFNANKGHSLKPLSDVASGGELSRVMLSIKSIISDKKLLPTILFDEIDNGLSGDVAGRVGDVLSEAASRMQVIAVTHLPQIAGKARHHYSVYKQNKNNVTFSNIKFLDHKERVTELAKMIGGRDVTAASLAAAEELLTTNQ